MSPIFPRKEVTLPRGARENGLPEEYIQMIESIESDADPDNIRHERELAMYR